MIFSCRSSSLTRLAIAAGSPRPKPWNSQQSKQNHTKTPPKWPEIQASPARSGPGSPQPNRDRPPSPAGGCALLGARARARTGAGRRASPREIPHARACGGRGGGETTRWWQRRAKKARLFCCCCVASLRVLTEERKKKLFSSWGLRGGDREGRRRGREGCRSAAGWHRPQPVAGEAVSRVRGLWGPRGRDGSGSVFVGAR